MARHDVPTNVVSLAVGSPSCVSSYTKESVVMLMSLIIFFAAVGYLLYRGGKFAKENPGTAIAIGSKLLGR
jgi:hypothetical protein